MTEPHVYEAINAVMAQMSQEGISKNRRNKDQGYNFRGIDDIYMSLSSALVTAGLLMLPRAKSHRHDIRQTKSGSNQYVAIMEVDFDLVSAVDGSKHTITTFGEAYDMADKSTNKAMSAAYKYAALQAFCIPTEGDNDADAVAPEQTIPVPSSGDRFLSETHRLTEASKSQDDLRTLFDTRMTEAKSVLDETQMKQFNGIFNARKKAIIAATETPFDGAQ